MEDFNTRVRCKRKTHNSNVFYALSEMDRCDIRMYRDLEDN